ncbi:MAG: threonylcarbamoyl-AMP synthase [Clostridiales bacterium]|nr:threonylcarbamoyl-AMP synthase [Clostridiales bacterium]
MNTQILQFNSKNTQLCADEILSGGLVAFPTETVYGLGANALNPEAVKKIYDAKGRPSDNPLICHIYDKAQIEQFAFITPTAEKLIDKFMPGPITIVLQKKQIVPSVVTGGLDTVGIRMPNHKCALELIRECGVPLCAPSANTSTKPSPTLAEHVLHDLDGKIKYILDGGRCSVGLESTIVDCVNNTLLRQGGTPKEEIEAVIGKLNRPIVGNVPLCPGMKYKHYSPNANVYLALPGIDMHRRIEQKYDEASGKKIILSLGGNYGDRNTYCIGNSVEEYAYNLFAQFRRLDGEGYDIIICEGVDDYGVGAALMNRIHKASGGKTI